MNEQTTYIKIRLPANLGPLEPTCCQTHGGKNGSFSVNLCQRWAAIILKLAPAWWNIKIGPSFNRTPSGERYIGAAPEPIISPRINGKDTEFSEAFSHALLEVAAGHSIQKDNHNTKGVAVTWDDINDTIDAAWRVLDLDIESIFNANACHIRGDNHPMRNR